MDTERNGHDEQPTCGKGLAANAVLPARLAELLALQAEVLRRHALALDLTDEHAQREHAAYQQLERAERAVAGELANLATAMESCRDLPMGRHDMSVMTDPNGQMEAFQQFIGAERDLMALLQQRLAVAEQMAH